jgi:hypothetical protein
MIKQDSLFVKDFTYELINPNSNIEISEKQYSGYNSIISSRKKHDDIVRKNHSDSLRLYYNLDIPDSETNLAGGRFLRYHLALKIFKDYTLLQKIFGNGMNYLATYGKVFYSTGRDYDYPHSPILSAFLYSGMFGGFIYIWFLIKVFIGYYKRRKEFGIVTIMFLICFSFAFFSGNSHFSIPLYAILSFFPFLPYNSLSNIILN